MGDTDFDEEAEGDEVDGDLAPRRARSILSPMVEESKAASFN